MEPLQALHSNTGLTETPPSFFETRRFVPEEEYWEKYYICTEFDSDVSYEWNNGYLEERPMTDPDSYFMYHWLSETLHQYLTVFPVADAMSLEFGFRLKLPGKTVIRKPDMGVVLKTNPELLGRRDRSYRGVFDLCIESLSDSNPEYVIRDTEDKKQEYASGGVREYYILDAKGDRSAFYRLGKKGKYHAVVPKNGIIRSEVLKGFQFRISDLRSQPSLKEMAEDPVYQRFILPFYQAEKLRVEEEKQRAEEEKQRAEEEKQRAEEEKQKAEAEKQRAEEEKQKAVAERQRADEEKQRADEEKQKAEAERQRADEEKQKAEAERQRAEEEKQRAEAEKQRADEIGRRLILEQERSEKAERIGEIRAVQRILKRPQFTKEELMEKTCGELTALMNQLNNELNPDSHDNP